MGDEQEKDEFDIYLASIGVDPNTLQPEPDFSIYQVERYQQTELPLERDKEIQRQTVEHWHEQHDKK